jgi:hypothetical protein
MTNRDNLRDLSVFLLLTAIGVVGRWVQPDWHFTPLMAVTVLGGFYFRSLLAAVLLPVGILTISDLALNAHDSVAVHVSVYLMMIVPLVLGRWARGSEGWQLAGHGILCGVVPATAFFLVTNFAHWASTSMYEHTWAGLMNCYAAAVPFYRAMLSGDLFYLTLLVGCLALASAKSPELVRERVKK